MRNPAVAFVSVVLFVSAVSAAAAQAPKSADWVPVDQDVWTVVMEEPQSHFLRARLDLSKKDARAAANEIRMAGNMLKLEQGRLEAASRQLNSLANDVASGKVVSDGEMESVFNNAIRVLDRRQTFLPVMQGADVMYMDEADYHLARARMLLNNKEIKDSAADIRKAEAYLKLKAAHAGAQSKAELLASAAELDALARKVEEGGVTAAKELDQAFDRAHKAVRKIL